MSMPSRTYENMFYMKKSFEQLSPALRIPSRISSVASEFEVNQISHPLHTLTECDEVEERRVFESRIPRRSKPGPSRPKRPFTCASSRSSRLNIKNDSQTNRTPGQLGSTTTSTTTSLMVESKTQTEVSGVPSLHGSRLVLPGHGGPRLEVPPLTKTPGQSCEDVAYLSHHHLDVPDQDGSSCCRGCNRLKLMLQESEANVQYLTQQMRNTDRDLKVIADRLNNNAGTMEEESPEGERLALIPYPNPLVKVPRNEDKCCGTGDLRYKYYPSTASTNEIPKFDLDNFFMQFFEHPLMKEKTENGESESPNTFSKLQLLQASVAARDCMAHTLEQKLQDGYKVLKARFETMGKDDQFQSTEKDSPGMFVLNSYRKFVRFIYYYLKESLEEIEEFDQIFMEVHSKDRTPDGLKYSYMTTMIINHKPISGVFIPLEFNDHKESKN